MAPPSRLFLILFIYLFIYLLLFRVASVAYGGSQARGRFGATAASLHHSHSRDLYHSSWQHRIFNPLSKARDQTFALRDASQILSTEPQRELQDVFLKVRSLAADGLTGKCPTRALTASSQAGCQVRQELAQGEGRERPWWPTPAAAPRAGHPQPRWPRALGRCAGRQSGKEGDRL